MIHRLLIFAGCFLSMTGVFADTLPFRSGEILAAELSQRKVSVQGENACEYPRNFDKCVYAAVACRIVPGRKLSVYDYSIEVFGTRYPCVAIRTGSGAFRADVKTIDAPEEKTVYTMLFVLDGNGTGIDKTEDLTLVSNFPEKSPSRLELPFTNRFQQPFTAPIPAAGLMR